MADHGSGASLQVAPLSGASLVSASRVLGRAFRDNPINRAVLPGRSARGRCRANSASMRAQLASALQGGLVLGACEGDSLCGALIAVPPGRHPLHLPPLALRLRAFLAQGPRATGRLSRVFDALQAVHPERSHWYLSIVGVDPSRSGRGIGSALLRALLAHVAESPAPVYLETDEPRNLPFYDRFGFSAVGELRVLGVHVWRMERPEAGLADATKLGSGS